MKKIVTFDLETTGLDKDKDRIIQFCFLKTDPETMQSEVFTRLVDPEEIEIPAEATAVHGISIADIYAADAKSFVHYAKDIAVFMDIENNAIAGYNILNFDLPFLANEMRRVGFKDFADKIMKALDEPDRQNILTIDALQIFQKKFKRDLTNAAEYYLNTKFEDAHDAEADVRMTQRVLFAQMIKYNLSETDAAILSTDPPDGFMDRAARIKTGGIFDFGKHKGRPVAKVNEFDRNYIQWILTQSEMPENTKNIIRRLTK